MDEKTETRVIKFRVWNKEKHCYDNNVMSNTLLSDIMSDDFKLKYIIEQYVGFTCDKTHVEIFDGDICCMVNNNFIIGFNDYGMVCKKKPNGNFTLTLSELNTYKITKVGNSHFEEIVGDSVRPRKDYMEKLPF